MIYFEEFQLSTPRHEIMIEITRNVREIVHRAVDSGISNGIVWLYTPHTTAALTINENADSDVESDIIRALKEISPKINFDHMEGNSDAHIKSSLFSCDARVLLVDKNMQLGTWQGIFFCEFDGPRTRRVFVQVMGE